MEKTSAQEALAQFKEEHPYVKEAGLREVWQAISSMPRKLWQAVKGFVNRKRNAKAYEGWTMPGEKSPDIPSSNFAGNSAPGAASSAASVSDFINNAAYKAQSGAFKARADTANFNKQRLEAEQALDEIYKDMMNRYNQGIR
jgi:hypothetical protein